MKRKLINLSKRLFLFGCITYCVNIFAYSWEEREFVHKGKNQEIDVKIVFPTKQKNLAAHYEIKVRKALSVLEDFFHLNWQDDISIFFDDRPIHHNGLATALPTNRILIHTIPPSINTSLGVSQDYLYETIVHELSHFLSFQQRGGLFGFFPYLVGNVARPLATWPRWIHEGIAVWGESLSGGRPKSGIIDLHLRQFAEYYSRKKKFPFNNSDLSGYPISKRVSQGHLPYHFGYLFLKQIFDNDTRQLAQFITNSNASFGLSFRPQLKKMNIDLDREFKNAQNSWKDTPYPKKNPSSYREKSSYSNLIGPFGTQTPAWASFKSGSDWTLHTQNKKTIWESSGRGLNQVFNRNDHWVLHIEESAINSNHQNINKVILVKNSQECELALTKESLREIFVFRNLISWIEINQNSQYIVKKAQYTHDCKIKDVSLIFQSQAPLQRLSSLYYDGQNTAFSLAPKDGEKSESIFFNGKLVKGKYSLTHPRPVSKKYCRIKSQPCFLALMQSRSYVGPILIQMNRPGHAESYRLSLKTGSRKFSPKDNGLLANVEYWEKNRLAEISLADFKHPAQKIRIDNKKNHRFDSVVIKDKNERYGAWPSIFPHFFLPFISFQNQGSLLGASTFFSDLSERWSGDLFAAYDTFTQDPSASLSITRKSLGLGPYTQMDFNAVHYTANFVFQKRSQASLNFSTIQKLSQNWRFLHSFGGRFVYAQASNFADKYTQIIPSMGLSVYSRKAINPKLPYSSISNYRNSLQLHGRGSWHEGYAGNYSLFYQTKILRSGIMLGLEYAHNDAENFPSNFYSWGGSNLFTAQHDFYSNRGYAVDTGLARDLARVSFEWGLKIADINKGFSWNRFRFQHVDFRAFFESITQKSYSSQSTFKIFEDHFPTVGGEIDFFIRSLDYINTKLSLGVYKGLDEQFGELRYGLVLQSALDL